MSPIPQWQKACVHHENKIQQTKNSPGGSSLPGSGRDTSITSFRCVWKKKHHPGGTKPAEWWGSYPDFAADYATLSNVVCQYARAIRTVGAEHGSDRTGIVDGKYAESTPTRFDPGEYPSKNYPNRRRLVAKPARPFEVSLNRLFVWMLDQPCPQRQGFSLPKKAGEKWRFCQTRRYSW